jgi:Sushi repeat (SCR repeat)
MESVGNTTVVLGGSYIVVSCLSGYTNIGGSLNITCLSNNSWTYFPNCNLNSGSVAITTTTTTTMSPGTGQSCPVSIPATFTIANGYTNNLSSLSLISNTAATGTQIMFIFLYSYDMIYFRMDSICMSSWLCS